MGKFRWVFIVVIPLILVAAAIIIRICNPSAKERETRGIVGTWKRVDGTQGTMKFNADGTFERGDIQDAHWAILDGHIVHWWGKIPGKKVKRLYDYDELEYLKLNGDDLTFYSEGSMLGTLPMYLHWHRQ